MSANRKALRDSANSFEKASERCFEQRQLPNNQIQFLVVPAVVNLAFSAELFMKFLLNSFKKEHRLINLYNRLDEPTKLEVVRLSSYEKDIFEELLTKHSKAFEEWRYLHESESERNVNPNFMSRLVSSLHEISNRVII